jgi:Fur family transcriptional regulator, ferric uptake regulator
MAEWKHEHGNLATDAAGRLRSHGGRMTAQRRLILEAFRAASEHPTAAEIHDIARRKDPSLNLSTVYRTMRWLEQEGLVQTRLFGDESRSERFDSAIPTAHHHFICTRCHRIVEFDAASLAALVGALERRHAFQVAQSELVLYGLCADCRPEKKPARKAAVQTGVPDGR